MDEKDHFHCALCEKDFIVYKVEEWEMEQEKEELQKEEEKLQKEEENEQKQPENDNDEAKEEEVEKEIEELDEELQALEDFKDVVEDVGVVRLWKFNTDSFAYFHESCLSAYLLEGCMGVLGHYNILPNTIRGCPFTEIPVTEVVERPVIANKEHMYLCHMSPCRLCIQIPSMSYEKGMPDNVKELLEDGEGPVLTSDDSPIDFDFNEEDDRCVLCDTEGVNKSKENDHSCACNLELSNETLVYLDCCGFEMHRACYHRYVFYGPGYLCPKCGEKAICFLADKEERTHRFGIDGPKGRLKTEDDDENEEFNATNIERSSVAEDVAGKQRDHWDSVK
jgi:hypothetical protein